MRDTLEALAAGELTVAEAESRLAGYATTDAGRFDAARETRRGIPEAILAEGKTPDEVASLAVTALETTGRALVTRADLDTADRVREAIADRGPDAATDQEGTTRVDHDETTRTVVARAADAERPSIDAQVTIVTGGTADAPIAGEAAVTAREIGADVDLVTDVGVANLHRMVDQIETLREADILIVAAGREGALPTVVAGLVDAPVIGLPVSIGYGVGGDGEAALYGMLQSCTVLSTVNVDAGFVAGAQAGLIARAIAAGSTA